HEVNRQTIARGKPGCLGCTCQIRVRLSTICTRRCGCGKRPAFPAPSLRRGTMNLENSGETSYENENACLYVIASEAKQSSFFAAETKLDCFVASLLAMTG